MPRIKALRRITDAGYNLSRGAVSDVDAAIAAEWIAQGWADIAPEQVAKKPEAKKK
jgi:hypothetical protein